MASVTVRVPQGFPVGTTLGAYVDRVGDISPQGAVPVSTAAIQPDGTITITGLTPGIPYQVGALIGGAWRSFLVEATALGDPYQPIAAGTAANGSAFVDSADGVLKFKDSTGAVTPLYGEGGAVADLREFDQIKPWKTSLGAVMTAGQPTLTNTAVPFTSADAGKTVIVNKDAGGRFMTTILSVNASGVATLAANAPSSTTNQRVQWGFDCTTALNAALLTFAADNATTRHVVLPGWFRVQYVEVPPGIWLEGVGWGSVYPFPNAPGQSVKGGTVLQQLPGANRDLMTFGLQGTSGGRDYMGPVQVTHLNLVGPETDVTGFAVSAGSGLAARTAAGSVLTPQDGTLFDSIHAMGFYRDGFEFPNGVAPAAMRSCRAFYNGRYGAQFTHLAIDGNSVALGLLDFSGDGNSSGLVLFKNFAPWSSIAVTNIKAEKGDFQTTAGGGHQESTLIFEDCDNTPVAINGLSQISSVPGGAHTEAPGPAIVVRSATDMRPRIQFGGVANRLYGDETSNVANAVALRDEVIGVDIPQTVARGQWPPFIPLGGTEPTTGEEIFSRDIATGGVTLTSGTVRGSSFTCRKTETRSILQVLCLTAQAGAAPTILKAAVFKEDPTTGDLTREAVSSNSTAHLAVIDTLYDFTLTAPYKFLAGRRYAIALICVTAGTAPAVWGQSSTTAKLTSKAPRVCFAWAGQTDMPSTITNANQGATNNRPWALTLP